MGRGRGRVIGTIQETYKHILKTLDSRVKWAFRALFFHFASPRRPRSSLKTDTGPHKSPRPSRSTRIPTLQGTA